MLRNDEGCDGVFFYAVASTGIYCRPSCKSRPPKRENVTFFRTGAEAEAAGFRACKRCRSDLCAYEPVRDAAVRLKALLDAMPLDAVRVDVAVKTLGLSRKRATEIFNTVYGITPHAYACTLRFAGAQNLLTQTSTPIVHVAYAVGFESVSAFYRFFQARARMSPAAYRRHTTCEEGMTRGLESDGDMDTDTGKRGE